MAIPMLSRKTNGTAKESIESIRIIVAKITARMT